MIAAIDKVVRRTAPQLLPRLEGRMLGYGRFHYRYESGRSGHTFVTALMDGAQALSVYLLGGQGDQYLAEANAARLGTSAGKPSVGKSCIRVKRLDHLDLDVYAELLTVAAAQHAEALTED